MRTVELDQGCLPAELDTLTRTHESEVDHQDYLMTDLLGRTTKASVQICANKFFELGIQGLDDYEILELIFSFVSSDGAPKEWASKCLNHFSNLRGVIQASHKELLYQGLPWLATILVRLLAEIPVKVLAQSLKCGPVYQSSQELYTYLNYSMRGLGNEIFRVLYLDGANRIIETLDVTGGIPNSVAVFPRKVLEYSIRYQATSMLLAHNHPAGNPLPSRKDKMLTRDLVFLGKALQVEVLDHIIVGDNNHFSFFDEGLITQYEDSFLMMRRRAVT